MQVFFPILKDHHFFVLCYDFGGKKIIILDNRLEGEDATSRYKHTAMAMVKISQTQNPYFICKNITPITLTNYVQTNLFAIYLLNG